MCPEKLDNQCVAVAALHDGVAHSIKNQSAPAGDVLFRALHGTPPSLRLKCIRGLLKGVVPLGAELVILCPDDGQRPGRTGAGLQRAVAEHIQAEFGSNAAAGQTGTTVLKSDQLQTFLWKNAAALRTVMTPQQVDSLNRVALDLQRANLSNAGTKAAVGSDTVQNQGIMHSLLGMAVRAGVGKSIGVVAGLFHAGWGGALAGEKLGAMADQMVAHFRAAGIRSAGDLVTEAMLNPALANVLLARVNDQTRPNVLKALGAVLSRAVAANAGAGFVSAEGRGR